jgi:serine/threonine protein kinase
MSRRRQSNTKHGRKRPGTIAPPDQQPIGQDDALVPNGGAPAADGSVTTVALSGEVVAGGDQQGAARPSPAAGPSGAGPPEQRPKTPPVIDPDAPTSVLPASELPAPADGSRRASGGGPRVSPVDASGFLARQPTPQPGEAVAVPKICPHCGEEYETDARFCPKDGTALRPKGGSDALIGRVIADRYHVLKVIGEGGMGRIYLAEHVRMNRQCALKVMRPNLVHDADSAARFGREASNAARIIHPNVAAVFDYGETEGLVYLVMEYVEGDPLGEILQRGGALAPARALAITKQVTDALNAAHELGIVHRDLKPDNIIVTRSKSGREVAKVVDFGIAKAIAESPDRRLTETGLVIGTPEFMSPEQLVGDPADARSDIYSLGCILYLMLVGHPAADAPTRDAMLKRRLNELPPHPSRAKNDLPPELDAIVVRMLAISPADRYQSAAELRAALDEVRLGSDVDTVLTTSGAMAVPRPSLDPSTAPTIEVPVPIRLPSWAPDWMRRPTVQRAARKALTVASFALVGGAVVGAALSAVMQSDGDEPRDTVGVRGDSVAQSGTRPAPSGATSVVTSDTTKTPAGTGAAGAGAPRSTTTGTRAPTPTTPRGSTTVAGRTRSETTAVRPPLERRSVIDIPPAFSPALVPIRRYAAAVRSGDVGLIKQAYPGLTDRQQKQWEELFRSAKPERAEITDVRGVAPFDANGIAVVDFNLAVRVINKNTGDPVVFPTRYRARIKRQGPNLTLESLIDRSRSR